MINNINAVATNAAAFFIPGHLRELSDPAQIQRKNITKQLFLCLKSGKKQGKNGKKTAKNSPFFNEIRGIYSPPAFKIWLYIERKRGQAAFIYTGNFSKGKPPPILTGAKSEFFQYHKKANFATPIKRAAEHTLCCRTARGRREPGRSRGLEPEGNPAELI